MSKEGVDSWNIPVGLASEGIEREIDSVTVKGMILKLYAEFFEEVKRILLK